MHLCLMRAQISSLELVTCKHAQVRQKDHKKVMWQLMCIGYRAELLQTTSTVYIAYEKKCGLRCVSALNVSLRSVSSSVNLIENCFFPLL